MYEKRIKERIRTLIKVEVLKDGSRSETGKGYVTNISETGARIETSVGLVMNEKVKILFRESGAGELPASIVWKKSLMSDFFAYGVRFDKNIQDFRTSFIKTVTQKQ